MLNLTTFTTTETHTQKCIQEKRKQRNIIDIRNVSLPHVRTKSRLLMLAVNGVTFEVSMLGPDAKH